MASNDIEAYKPPSFYHHDDVDLKTVGNGNCIGMTVNDDNLLLLCDCNKSKVLVFDKINRFSVPDRNKVSAMGYNHMIWYKQTSDFLL